MSPSSPIIVTPGQLRWNEELGAWIAEVEWSPGAPIQFSMTYEDQWAKTDPAKLAEIGTAFLGWAKDFEPLCRDRIADDLLDVYNRSWADDDPDEGPPKLNRAEFLNALGLTAIDLQEPGYSSWRYASGDLFAGHGINVMPNPDRSFLGEASLEG
jgi:hypothetical protein